MDLPSFLHGVEAELVVTPAAAVAVVVSTVLIYLVFVVILEFSRQTMNIGNSPFELAVLAVLGAIVGRTTLGPRPTLITGVIALVTLGVVRVVVGRLRLAVARRSGHGSRGRRRGGPRPLGSQPRVVMVGARIRQDVLRHLHLQERELWSKLRTAGISSAEQVAVVVVEASGELTVLRAGTPIDRRILQGVLGAHTVPEEMLA